MIKNETLRNYADLLERNGFAIYEPKGEFASYFMYSQIVGETECFGTVEIDYFGHVKHHMPIRPSREHGSSMFVEGVPDELTVETAKAVARQFNSNKIVGRHANYRDDRFMHLYNKRETAK